jgi:hypothetical protein
MEGDLKALQIVLDRTEGKPHQSVALQGDRTSSENTAFEIRYVNDWQQVRDSAGLLDAQAQPDAP